MQTAELHRKRYELEEIYFIFVPGSKGGFRDDSLPKNIPQRHTFMRNVLIPSCWLLPSCKGASWLQIRDEINPIFENANHVFPRGYTPQTPKIDYLRPGQTSAYLRGEKQTQMQEPPEFEGMVQSFLADRIEAEKKLITVTIRDAPYNNQRNTNCFEWSTFLNKLNPAEYKVIIIPDTFNLWSRKIDGFEYCEMASANILFRTALYRKAYLNMMTSQGPSMVAFHSSSPMLAYGPINTDIATTEYWWRKVFSLEPEESNQHPMFKINQRIAWGPETAKNIEQEFSQFANDFPEIPIQPLKRHGIQSNRHKQLVCEAVLEYTAEKIALHQVIQEDIDALEAIIKLDEKFIGAKHLLGIIASNIGQYASAIKLFDDCIELSSKGYHREIIGNVRFQSDGSNPTEYRLLKAETLEKNKDLGLALREYLKIHEINREDPSISNKILELNNKLN